MKPAEFTSPIGKRMQQKRLAICQAAGLLGFSLAAFAPQPAYCLAASQIKPVTAAPKRPVQALKERRGYIIGRCLDKQGKPLSGVRLRVFGVTEAGQNVNFQTKTNAAGQYAIKLPRGNFHMGWALQPVSFAGMNYFLPLSPTDGEIDDADSAAGIVENFVLKISGRITPQSDPKSDLSYYGGSVAILGGALENGSTFTGYSYRFPEGSSIVLTLKPQGPLIDGSAGKTLTLRQPASAGRFLDFPIGKYEVTAELINADGTSQPLRVAAAQFSQGFAGTLHKTPKPNEFAPQAALVSPPGGDSIPLLKLPGVSGAQLYVQP